MAILDQPFGTWAIAFAVVGAIFVIFALGFIFLRGKITGPKFFAIFASFFVVIIVVNIAMARFAVSTFPGVEVANSYVASQSFDADREAQLALGWDVSAEVEHGSELVLRITKAGVPVAGLTPTGIFGRATNVRDDQEPRFVFDGQSYRAPIETSGGYWNLRLEVIAPDGTPFRQRIEVPIH